MLRRNLESHLKRKCRLYVEERFEGRIVSSSPKGWTGYPDSDLLIPGCPIVKVEFKRGQKESLRAAQDRWARWFITNNIHYWKIGDFDEFVECCENHWIDRRPLAPARGGRALAVDSD